ncbi:MAG TPA: NAD(P)/FAD-dependent oxidoreductase [Gemmatales bacterium]|nr:NAD(P)/FAD-dependent oxidoreductase [Gemmatales bacterium]
MKSGTITLIGAGLVGSLLSVFLARRGYQVTIYERRADLRKANISAGRSINLALANRGLAALERAGLLDAIRPVLLPMAGRMLHDEQGQTSFLPYGHRPEEVIYSVSRGGLNQRLLDLAEVEGVNIQFQRNCLDVDFATNILQLIDETSGTQHNQPFERVIGTDGSASRVREAIIRATGGHAVESPLGHGYKELCILPDSQGGFRMDNRSLHIWPRGEFMLIALPNPDASFTLTLFLPNTGTESFATLTSAGAVNSFFSRYFPDAQALMPDLTTQFLANPLGTLGTIRSDTWHYRDQALLLGDAAHAIVPFHGQGMNCGFEDTVALDECLNHWDDDWEQLFARFFALRKPNADAIAEMALENYVEMRATVRDPKFALKKALSFVLEDRFGPRFIPRYSMVMFHTMPYAEAKQRGNIQENILNLLVASCNRLEEIDYTIAAKLIHDRL